MQSVNCRLIGKLLIRNETKFLTNNGFQISTYLYLFPLRRAGKTQQYFTCRSARRPSQAGKPEAQFRFVELRPSACSCFPKKARVHFQSELRLRFPSPPIPRLFKTPKLNLAKAKAMNHQKYCKLSMRIWKRNDIQYFTKIFLRLIKVASF